jgi:hypothetical protein
MTGSGRVQPDVIFQGAVLAFLALTFVVWSDDVGLVRNLERFLGGGLLIFTIAVVVWVALYLRQKPTTPTAQELSRRFDEVRFMDGGQFEAFVADLFMAMGHRAQLCGGRGIRASTSSWTLGASA